MSPADCLPAEATNRIDSSKYLPITPSHLTIHHVDNPSGSRDKVHRIMRAAVGLFLLLLVPGCAVPMPFTHDYGLYCGVDGLTVYEVRKRETGWVLYRGHLALSQRSDHCRRKRASTRRRTTCRTPRPSQSRPRQSHWPALTRRARTSRKRPARCGVRLRRAGPNHPRDVRRRRDRPLRTPHLDPADAGPLRRLGFEMTTELFGGNYRWDSPAARWYLTDDEHAIQVCCPQTGFMRRLTIGRLPRPRGYAPIWDPASHEVILVDSDFIHAGPPTAVTVWNYVADEARQYQLRR